MKWINGMTMNAKLFPIVDIITVISGIQIVRSREDKIDEIVRHVTGLPCMPAKGSEARQLVVDAVRTQLPSSLTRFGSHQLIDIIFDIKSKHDEDSVRPELIRFLERRYGRRLPLCPQKHFLNPSEGFLLLQSIATDCGQSMRLSNDS